MKRKLYLEGGNVPFNNFLYRPITGFTQQRDLIAVIRKPRPLQPA